MSQNQSCHELQRTSHRLPSSGNLVTPITGTVREQQPLEADLQAVVLSSVADRVPWLSTPDVLALRTQIAADVDDQAPLVERVATIVDAILTEVEHWKRGATA